MSLRAVLAEQAKEGCSALAGHPAPESLLIAHSVRKPLNRLMQQANFVDLGIEAV